MDTQQSTKMPKPFDSDIALNEPTPGPGTTTITSVQHIELREEPASEPELTPAQRLQREAEAEHLRQEVERVKREEEEAFRLAEEERLRREADYRQELLKVQDEIVTLRQVLSAKLKRESELKGLLNLGFMDELKQDWAETMSEIKAMPLFQRSHAHYNTASEKVGPVAATAGGHLKTGFGHLRNTQYYKSFEEKVGSTTSAFQEKLGSTTSAFQDKFGSTVTAVKSKIAPSKSTAEISQNGDTVAATTTTGGTTITTSATVDNFNTGASADVISK